MGGCQNYEAFLGTLDIWCRIKIGIQRDHNFDNHPYGNEPGVCRDQRRLCVRPRGERGSPNHGKPDGKETEQAIEKGCIWMVVKLLSLFGSLLQYGT